VQNSLYVALSSQIALEHRLDTIADNVANANTVGFRATKVKFSDLVFGQGEGQMDFVTEGDTFLSPQDGPLRQTGNAFDFAVRGDAWFGIQTPSGTVMTRDGRFTMLNTGDLVTLEGYPVLDAGGAPIQLNPRAGAPTAGSDGSLRQNGQQIGAIGLFKFEPGANFTRFGNSGLVPATPPQPAIDNPNVGVAQGFVEDSNVNPVQEMTRLIMVQRAFENAAALVRQNEASFTDAIKTLGSK
jgi:flagellar basal-body rod protein FlgF